MYKHLKIIYTCFSIVLLSFTLFISISINKTINIQEKIMEEKQNELNHIIAVNQQIKINNHNLEELQKRNEEIDKLNEEESTLLERKNILQASINKYNWLNNELQSKINYYEY